jgi:chemotaxis protein histidine kinase CheA
MSGETFTDASMLEIFRAEVETHVEALTTGLLALERDPSNTSQIDRMMRGAHSIKGAARIVGIDPAVRVAHVMEDGFIAAQNGQLVLNSDHVDVLLRGVDFLNRMASATKNSAVDWKQFGSEANPLVNEITAVLHGPATPGRDSGTMVDRGVAIAHKTANAASPEITIVVPALLDAVAAETARRELLAAIEARAVVVRFDLSKTTDLDAIGLAFLATVPEFAGQSNVRVELTGGSTDLRYVLDVTGVERLYRAGG